MIINDIVKAIVIDKFRNLLYNSYSRIQEKTRENPHAFHCE